MTHRPPLPRFMETADVEVTLAAAVAVTANACSAQLARHSASARGLPTFDQYHNFVGIETCLVPWRFGVTRSLFGTIM